MRHRTIGGLLAAALLAAAPSAPNTPSTVDDWTRYRGANGAGISAASGLPITFGPEENVVWKTELPPGHSSPIVVGDRIYVTAFDEDRLLTLALDQASGEILWEREIVRDRAEEHDKRNTPASPTPTTDGDNVFVFFADFGLLSYSRDGVECWRMPLGPFDNAYGMASSPIVVGDKVVLVCDQNTGSFIVAVGKDDGETVWLEERPEAKSGYSTPSLWTPPGEAPQLLVPGSFMLSAYNIETGDKIWWVTGLSFEMKATPVLGDDLVYIHGRSQADEQIETRPWEEVHAANDANGDGYIDREEAPEGRAKQWFRLFDLSRNGVLDETEWKYYRSARATRGGLLAFRLGGHGDMTATNKSWEYHKAVPQLPSSLFYGGVLHTIDDAGVVTVFDPATGAVLNQGRVEGAIDSYYASPIGADGRIYLLSELGKAVVMAADGSLDVLAVNDLDDLSYATPAIVDNRIYIRTRGALYAFGLEERAEH